MHFRNYMTPDRFLWVVLNIFSMDVQSRSCRPEWKRQCPKLWFTDILMYMYHAPVCHVVSIWLLTIIKQRWRLHNHHHIFLTSYAHQPKRYQDGTLKIDLLLLIGTCTLYICSGTFCLQKFSQLCQIVRWQLHSRAWLAASVIHEVNFLAGRNELVHMQDPCLSLG